VRQFDPRERLVLVDGSARRRGTARIIAPMTLTTAARIAPEE